MDHQKYFYVMEFIDGQLVDEYVKNKGMLTPLEALDIGVQVTHALAAAAKQGLVHPDLKPANLILLDEEGEKVVKVTNFGLAKRVERESEESRSLPTGRGFLETPLFASPEQLEEHDIDVRSNIYSGCHALLFSHRASTFLRLNG
jgi:serine/threonine protein kinase